MKRDSLQKPMSEEERLAFMSEGVGIHAFQHIHTTGFSVEENHPHGVAPMAKKVPFYGLCSDEIKTLGAPAEVLHRLRFIPDWLSNGIFEQLEDCLLELGVFTRLLSSDLFALSLKVVDARKECIALSEQASILNRVAREALPKLHKCKKAYHAAQFGAKESPKEDEKSPNTSPKEGNGADNDSHSAAYENIPNDSSPVTI